MVNKISFIPKNYEKKLLRKKQKQFGITVSQDIQHIWQLMSLENAFHLIRIPLLVKNAGKNYVKLTNQLK